MYMCNSLSIIACDAYGNDFFMFSFFFFHEYMFEKNSSAVSLMSFYVITLQMFLTMQTYADFITNVS